MRIREGKRSRPTQTLRITAYQKSASATKGAVLQSTSLCRLGSLDKRNFGFVNVIAGWIVGDVVAEVALEWVTYGECRKEGVYYKHQLPRRK